MIKILMYILSIFNSFVNKLILTNEQEKLLKHFPKIQELANNYYCNNHSYKKLKIL